MEDVTWKQDLRHEDRSNVAPKDVPSVDARPNIPVRWYVFSQEVCSKFVAIWRTPFSPIPKTIQVQLRISESRTDYLEHQKPYHPATQWGISWNPQDKMFSQSLNKILQCFRGKKHPPRLESTISGTVDKIIFRGFPSEGRSKMRVLGGSPGRELKSGQLSNDV